MTQQPGGYYGEQSRPHPYNQVQPYQPAAPVAYRAPYPAVIHPQVNDLVSAGGRFGAFLLDALLLTVTLFIGWFIWSMITWANGQTPAKQLLGHVVADANTGESFGWGRMALRQFVIGGLLGALLNAVSCSLYFWIDSFMALSDRQRTLHDRMSGSVVRHI